jgi:hypothetical protein
VSDHAIIKINKFIVFKYFVSFKKRALQIGLPQDKIEIVEPMKS